MKKALFATIILLFFFSKSKSQQIDNVSSLRSLHSEKSVRLFYDNDFFSAQDQYYTQGINIELIDPVLNKNPLDKLLIYDRKQPSQHGLSIEHNGFTPSSIRHEEILYHDHPFAAAIMLKSFSRSYNSEKGVGISSAISLGVIGPAAFGKQMQTQIHEWLKNLAPLGWDHQIQNDVIVNYQLNLEKSIIKIPSLLIFSGVSSANIGTLNDKLSAGLQFQLGYFDKSVSEKPFEFKLYGKSEYSYRFYDATIEGGVFNHTNEYTLPKSEYVNTTLQNTIGISLRINKINLEYFQSILSKELEFGKSHRYGGISIAYLL